MSPGFEQLLFGSVDLVIDGQESSGWQVIQQTDGLDETTKDAIVRLIEPELAPICPLPGFPTPEEVRAADRRLVHRTIEGVPVLLHTAPAGQDTTGRPNTMTHVVVDHSETTVRPLLGADAWRAEWWCTPFGPDQMRQARLPFPTALRSGTSVTADAALEQVLRPGAAAVLGALADVVASNAENAARRHMAVLLVETVDDAAQWIGTLLRATAAEAARSANWSTLERVRGERDLEKLMSSGLDIAAVPLSDLAAEGQTPQGCVIVDPRNPPPGQPVTPFGRFVAAMASDPGLWLAAHESIHNQVLGQLVDQTGITFAWPAAMAQALSWVHGDTGATSLFGASSDVALRDDVETVLLQAAIPALASPLEGVADTLRHARENLVDEVNQRGPEGWRGLCHRIGDRAPEDRAAMLGRHYLGTAVRDPAWLLGGRAAASSLPENVRAALRRWSETESGAAEVLKLVGTAVSTIDSRSAGAHESPTVPARSIAWGQLASGFLDDGLVLDAECLAALLAPLATALLAPRAHDSAPSVTPRELAALVAALPEPGREELAHQVERGLAEIARQTADPRAQPVLAAPVAIALGPSLATPQRPWTRLQIALSGVVSGKESASGAVAALSALAGPPRRSSAALLLERESASALENSLLPEDLPALEELAAAGVSEARRWMLIVALRHLEHRESARYLSARRRNSPTIAEVKRGTVAPRSWEEGAALLGDGLSQPFLSGTMTPESAWTWAENVQAAAVQMRAGLSAVDEEPAVKRMLGELTRSAELRASAALVVLSVASPQLARRGTRVPLDLVDVEVEASRNPRGLFAAPSASWGEICLRALQTLAAEGVSVGGPISLAPPHGAPRAGSGAGGINRPEEGLGGGWQQDRPSVSHAGTSEAPGGPGLSAAAAAVLDARLLGAPEEATAALVREARNAFRGDAQGWARAQLIVPMLEDRRSSRVERLGDMVKKNLNMLPWQKKEGRDG
ncbi:GAP1-N2 domain-containing protein [Brachybacterium sp. 107]|uniref:GAP1-N2 domain-containing protein n=1 Tax=Brachybacterium sp. 107 TaxID=3457736 RepID=UPI004034B73C